MGIKVTGKEATLKIATDGIEKDARALFVAAHQAITSRTPVDTGQARANWFGDFGSIRVRVTESVALPDTGVGATWQISDGNFFIHNSVEHIIFLDEGSSQQAPQGILDPALAALIGRFG